MAKKKTVWLMVDGINLNATHLGNMSETEAVAAMKKDRITKDDSWAKNAHKQMVKKLDDEEIAEKKEEERVAEETKKKQNDADKKAKVEASKTVHQPTPVKKNKSASESNLPGENLNVLGDNK